MTEPTNKDPWKDDHLNRRVEAEFLERFLTKRIEERTEQGRSKSYVLNVNADWGQGKTFFMKAFAAQLEANGHLVACIDAWADDHADDPLIAVMSAINAVIAKAKSKLSSKAKSSAKSLGKVTAKLVVAGVKGAASQAASRYLGDAFSEEMKAAGDGLNPAKKAIEDLYDQAGKALVEKFETGKQSIGKFRTDLAAFLKTTEETHKPPLFILIDELDRCRPTYAISLLERVKHIFEVDNVVFVVATNTGQLQHAIRAVYGSEFDSPRYLNRFFDRSYQFEEPDISAFVDSLVTRLKLDNEIFSLPENTDLSTYIVGASEAFELTLRDTEQCLDVLRSIATVWIGRSKLELGFLYPMIVAQHRNFPVALNMSERIKEMASGPRANWLTDFGHFVHRGTGRSSPDRISGVELFAKYSSMAQRNYQDSFNQETTTPSDGFLRKRLFEDYKAHAQNNRTARPSWNDYPGLVSTAGRFRGTHYLNVESPRS